MSFSHNIANDFNNKLMLQLNFENFLTAFVKKFHMSLFTTFLGRSYLKYSKYLYDINISSCNFISINVGLQADAIISAQLLLFNGIFIENCFFSGNIIEHSSSIFSNFVNHTHLSKISFVNNKIANVDAAIALFLSADAEITDSVNYLDDIKDTSDNFFSSYKSSFNLHRTNITTCHIQNSIIEIKGISSHISYSTFQRCSSKNYLIFLHTKTSNIENIVITDSLSQTILYSPFSTVINNIFMKETKFSRMFFTTENITCINGYFDFDYNIYAHIFIHFINCTFDRNLSQIPFETKTVFNEPCLSYMKKQNYSMNNTLINEKSDNFDITDVFKVEKCVFSDISSETNGGSFYFIGFNSKLTISDVIFNKSQTYSISEDCYGGAIYAFGFNSEFVFTNILAINCHAFEDNFAFLQTVFSPFIYMNDSIITKCSDINEPAVYYTLFVDSMKESLSMNHCNVSFNFAAVKMIYSMYVSNFNYDYFANNSLFFVESQKSLFIIAQDVEFKSCAFLGNNENDANYSIVSINLTIDNCYFYKYPQYNVEDPNLVVINSKLNATEDEILEFVKSINPPSNITIVFDKIKSKLTKVQLALIISLPILIVCLIVFVVVYIFLRKKYKAIHIRYHLSSAYAVEFG